jgi:hypothetical protein
MFGLEPFQSKVVGVACVVLILMLSLIGYLLANSKREAKDWPPTIAVCPDYWEDATGTGKHCTNPHNLGKCDISSSGSNGVDLTAFTKPAMRCQAGKDFRDKCNLSWDGITNDDNACASADSKKKPDSSLPPYMTIFLVILVVIALMYLLSKRGKTEGATE